MPLQYLVVHREVSIIPVKKAKGGMIKKGYNKGGIACGASNPAARPMKKSK